MLAVGVLGLLSSPAHPLPESTSSVLYCKPSVYVVPKLYAPGPYFFPAESVDSSR